VPKEMKGLFAGSGDSRCRFLGLYDISSRETVLPIELQMLRMFLRFRQ
jgi:hypothetical protein